MALMEGIGFALVGVPIYDWLVTTRVGAYLTSFDYQYWPLTRLRSISVLLLAAGVFASFAILHPPDDRVWPLLIFFPPLILHGAVACADVFKQRREVLSGEREAFPDSD